VIRPRSPWRPVSLAFAFLAVLLLAGCSSHLKQAKFHYSEGQLRARAYETAQAAASYKRALLEAEKVVRSNPSAQAFTLKGLAEAGLEKWPDAEKSFLQAFALGFAEGEEWARDVSLLGLGSSLDELGLKDAALRSLVDLVDHAKFKPARLEAARRYADLSLAAASGLDDKEKTSALAAVAKTLEKLIDGDFACGFYHYLLSQTESHREDYRKSFEEAAIARELGLPTEKVLRDNDLQIVFDSMKMKERFSPDEWKAFEELIGRWTRKWGWRDPLTPNWKKE
jgi:tetratricopeptide (TPR) repeat protein